MARRRAKNNGTMGNVALGVLIGGVVVVGGLVYSAKKAVTGLKKGFASMGDARKAVEAYLKQQGITWAPGVGHSRSYRGQSDGSWQAELQGVLMPGSTTPTTLTLSVKDGVVSPIAKTNRWGWIT